MQKSMISNRQNGDHGSDIQSTLTMQAHLQLTQIHRKLLDLDQQQISINKFT